MGCRLPWLWQTNPNIRYAVTLAIATLGLDCSMGSLSHKFQSFDFVDWMNVSKDNLLERIGSLVEGDFLECLCELASAVHLSMWGISTQDDTYKIKVFRRLNSCLAAFSERLIIASDKVTNTKSKQYFNSMLVLVHHFMSLCGLKWLKHSRFRHHTVLFRRLQHVSKCPDHIDRERLKGAMAKWMCYLWWSPESTFDYCGKTNRTFGERTSEHVKCLHFPGTTRKKQTQPFYRIARRLGASLFFPFPLFSIAQSCETEIRMVEAQLISYFHSRTNMPFARNN